MFNHAGSGLSALRLVEAVLDSLGISNLEEVLLSLWRLGAVSTGDLPSRVLELEVMPNAVPGIACWSGMWHACTHFD